MADPYDWCQQSLFPVTSSFVAPKIEIPKPAPPPDPKHTAAAQCLAKVAGLLQDALDATTDTELSPILHEALELAGRYA